MRSQSLLDQSWPLTLLSAALCFGCVADDADPDDGMGGSSAGGSPAASGGTPAAGGSGGAGDKTGVDCSAPTTVTVPLITNFDGFAGGDATTYEFSFNGNAEGVGAIFAGLFALNDESGTYALEFVPGAGASTYALRAHNPAASNWGGGMGFWHGCLNASAYQGIQFMAKGSTPATTADMSIEMSTTESVSSKFDVPAEWTLVQLPFTGFAGSDKSPTAKLDGSRIGAIAFGTHLIWAPSAADPDTWVPDAGPIDLAIDDLSFY